MTIKEIHAKAGSLSGYLGYIFLVFGWYFLDNRFSAFQGAHPENSMLSLIDWSIRLVLGPLLWAGVFGGIYAQQRFQGEWRFGGFLHAIKTHALRFLGANLLSLVFFMIATIVVLATQGIDTGKMSENKLLAAIVVIPHSAISLFWFAAIVAERKVFRGLLRSLATLFLHPFALAIGFLWGVIALADSSGIEFPTGELSLPVDALRAAVVAVAKIGVIMYALAIYTRALGTAPESEEESLPVQSSSEEKLVKASYGFTFVSFLPFFHLIALILGIIALKRRKQFVLKAAVACCMGGFFTVFYAFVIVGWLLNRSTPSTAPGYAFLAERNPDLRPQITLLEQGAYQDVLQELEPSTTDPRDVPWETDMALALAKVQASDRKGSLAQFRTAASKNPERSEFYYYYGLALLEDSQDKKAAEQFEAALLHEPRLESAERYVDLIESTYDPSALVSALLYVFILMILFTLHEYGHAYTAWKLGDDTAEKQGRLTLNPIRHLDPFGSILLPAILLWQQSEFVFGWARPVPVDTRNFKNPRKDHMLVSFAGPAMNLIIAMVSLLLLGVVMLFLRLFWPETISLNLATPFAPISLAGPAFARWFILLILFLKQLFYTSLILGCFNLLPIPPLDGSWIVSGWLPERLRTIYEKTRQFGFLIFLLLMATSAFDYILIVPITFSWGALQLLVSAMGFG
jgi:Zn-dependent protease